MSQAQALGGTDRLPWLEDLPAAPKRRGNIREVAGWAVAAMLLVAGGSYWMGAHSWGPPEQRVTPPSSTTVALPPARQPQIRLAPEQLPLADSAPVHEPQNVSARPESRPAHIERHMLRAAPHRPLAKEIAIARPSRTSAQPEPALAAAGRSLPIWPASQSLGAYGRIVRIGSFGSRVQAKLGWRYMVAAYPAVADLPATVVETRNSRGRSFYRFQMGTTSQAHSEVLCQRMERIRLSCAVVGLPWDPKGVER